MKIGIVGGTGNISTAIVRLLLQRGHDVVCFNRGQAGAPPAGARVLHGDRHATAAFEQAMQAEKFDAAIDMLCFNAVDAASSRRAFRGVGMLAHCSTVCTYGVQSDWLPVTEDHALRLQIIRVSCGFVAAVSGNGAQRMVFSYGQAMQAEKFDAAIDMLCFDAADAASSWRAFRGVGIFVHCSTVCTYGVQSDWLPVTEDHAPCRRRKQPAACPCECGPAS